MQRFDGAFSTVEDFCADEGAGIRPRAWPNSRRGSGSSTSPPSRCARTCTRERHEPIKWPRTPAARVRAAAGGIADAAVVFGAMTVQQRVALGDEVFAEQPNLLASVLVQQRLGASLVQIEVLLNLLFVAHLAMKRSGRRWPLITEATQDRCLQRLTGRLHFAHGLAPRQFQQAVQDAIDDHREPYLLAYAYGHLASTGCSRSIQRRRST